MNLISLTKVIIKNVFYMQSLTRKLGEPVRLTKEECQAVYEGLKADKMMVNKFVLVCNIKTMSIDFEYNAAKFLKYKGQLDLNKYFFLLHPDFMEEYLKWGRATYAYAMEHKEIGLEPLNHCTRMTIPLKLANGKYYWVLQEGMALQLDANNNMVSHLNIYTILHEMRGDEDVVLVGQLYNNGIEVKEWTQTVWRDYFTQKAFELTPEQDRIVTVLHGNIDLSNAEIATTLNKKKNTIDMQNKQIIARAKASFPNHDFRNIKDTVRFLREIGYFLAEDIGENEVL